MNAHDFSSQWIDLDEEVPDFGNSPSIPVMVKDDETGELMKVTGLQIERSEAGGYTVWINVKEY